MASMNGLQILPSLQIARGIYSITLKAVMTSGEEVSSAMGLMPKWQLMNLFHCLEGSSIKSSSELYGFRGRSPQQTSSAIIAIANNSINISSPI